MNPSGQDDSKSPNQGKQWGCQALHGMQTKSCHAAHGLGVGFAAVRGASPLRHCWLLHIMRRLVLLAVAAGVHPLLGAAGIHIHSRGKQHRGAALRCQRRVAGGQLLRLRLRSQLRLIDSQLLAGAAACAQRAAWLLQLRCTGMLLLLQPEQLQQAAAAALLRCRCWCCRCRCFWRWRHRHGTQRNLRRRGLAALAARLDQADRHTCAAREVMQGWSGQH